MKKLVAMVLVAAPVLLVGVWWYFGYDDDPFMAKYGLIREGATHEEAERLFGDLGMTFGDRTYDWQSEDGAQSIAVTWNMRGVSKKALLAKDGTVILSEQFGWRRPWWERCLSMVGLR